MSLVSILGKLIFSLSDRKRDKGLMPHPNTRCHYNIPYGRHNPWNRLDLYIPRNHSSALPVILNIHGGAWIYGDKDTYRYYCMELANRGFAVINFSYRLAPEYKFPTALYDINHVVKWTLEVANIYNLNIDNIFMISDSAGAHLASLYNCICTNQNYGRWYAMKIPKSFHIKAIALNCGIYNLCKYYSRANIFAKQIIIDMAGKRELEFKLRFMSSNYYITKNFPPTFLMTSNGDFLRSETYELRKILRRNGVPHQYIQFGDKSNKLQHVFHCDIKLEESIQCMDEQIEFFRKYME